MKDLVLYCQKDLSDFQKFLFGHLTQISKIWERESEMFLTVETLCAFLGLFEPLSDNSQIDILKAPVPALDLLCGFHLIWLTVCSSCALLINLLALHSFGTLDFLKDYSMQT